MMNFKVTSTAGMLIMLVIIIAVAILGPFLTIWSINTLFNMVIPFTLETWAAVILLGIAIRGDGLKFGDKK
jgi:hypothetical protein